MADKPSFEYDDTTPAGWDPGVYRRQGGQGYGVSSRWGARPPEADEVAPRGTPAWRQAWQKMQDWIGLQLYTGATLGDMGFTREHEHGKQHFLRLSRGEYGGFRKDWFDASGNFPRYYIDPYTGQTRSTGGGGGGQRPSMGMPNQPAPTTGMQSTGPSAAPGGPSATPFTPPAPVVAPSASMGGSGGGPNVTSSDVYGQFPRGGKKRMAFGAAPPVFGGGPMGGRTTPAYDPFGLRSNATLIRKEHNVPPEKKRR